MQYAGISFVTTLPAPIVVLSPIVTPGQIIAPPPFSQTSLPIVIGLAHSLVFLSWDLSDASCINLNFRSTEVHFLYCFYLSTIQYYTIKIHIEIFSYMDIEPIVTMEREALS